MKSNSIKSIAAAIGITTFMLAQCSASAQEQRRGNEQHRWSEWAMKHPKWVDYHQKKNEYYQNHPDAAQRFMNEWYNNHPNEK